MRTALSVNDLAIVRTALSIVEQSVSFTKKALNDPQSVESFIRLKWASDVGYERESFCAIFLNSRHHLISFEILHSGGMEGCEVSPSVLCKRALLNNAVAVIICHNHPSGELSPSAADFALTQRLKQSLNLVDVRLLDHFIVTEHAITSFAQKGHL